MTNCTPVYVTNLKRLSIPFTFIGLASYSSIIWTQLLSLRLRIIGCHWGILVLLQRYHWIRSLYVSCLHEPFKCLVLMVLLWSMYYRFFSYIINLSVNDWLLMPFFVLFQTDPSHELLFKFNANSTISSDITSGCFLVGRSLVST